MGVLIFRGVFEGDNFSKSQIYHKGCFGIFILLGGYFCSGRRLFRLGVLLRG